MTISYAVDSVVFRAGEVHVLMHSTCQSVRSTGLTVIVDPGNHEVHARFEGPRAVAELYRCAADLLDDRRERGDEAHPEAYDLYAPAVHVGIRYHDVRLQGNHRHALEALARYFPAGRTDRAWADVCTQVLYLLEPALNGRAGE